MQHNKSKVKIRVMIRKNRKARRGKRTRALVNSKQIGTRIRTRKGETNKTL